MLVDNGSATDILYLSTFNRMGLSQEYMRLVMTPLYGFTWDSLISRGKISLSMSIREHPWVSTMTANFLVVECPSAYNTVIR